MSSDIIAIEATFPRGELFFLGIFPYRMDLLVRGECSPTFLIETLREYLNPSELEILQRGVNLLDAAAAVDPPPAGLPTMCIHHNGGTTGWDPPN